MFFSARPFRFRRFALSAVLTVTALPLALAPAMRPARAQTRPLSFERSLAEALKRHARWDPARRGPLLVVGAENVRRMEEPVSLSEAETAEQDAAKPLPLATVARAFDRAVHRMGSLTVLAPTTMTLLAPPSTAPAAYAGMGPDRATKALFATFTAAQWKRAGGANGIGASDLTRAQKAIWEAVIPNPFTVAQATTEGEDRNYTYDRQISPPQELTPAQRGAIRLRIQRTVSWLYDIAGSPGVRTSNGAPSGPLRRPGETFFVRAKSDREWKNGDNDPRRAVAVALRPVVPNKRKKSDLDYAAAELNAPVNLTDARTIADVVNRAAQASGLELYADPRLGRLSVLLGGSRPPSTASSAPAQTAQAARAGDVCAAVALAVTGTFRRVGTETDFAYVLTDDLEGLAPRRARQREWFDDALHREWSDAAAFTARMRKQAPLEAIGFAPDYPFAVPPAAMRLLEEKIASNDPDPRIPVALLTPAFLRQIKNDMERQSNGAQLRTDALPLQVSIGAKFLVPGVGEFDAPSVATLPELVTHKETPPAPSRPRAATGPAALPPALARRALLIAPDPNKETDDGAARLALAQAARRAGFTDLWIEVGEENEGETWATWATTARQVGLRAGLATRVLSRRLVAQTPTSPRSDTPENAEATPPAAPVFDRNFMGETSGAWAARRLAEMPETEANEDERNQTVNHLGRAWLVPDDPALPGALNQRLARLAQLPGVASLVLLDTAAPGYMHPANKGASLTYHDATAEQGFTPAFRLATLRASSVDPLDLSDAALSAYGGGGDLRLPFFALYNGSDPRYIQVGPSKIWTLQEGKSSASVVYGAFNRVRRDANAALMKSVGATLRETFPQLPIIVAARDIHTTPYFFGSWDKPDQIPKCQPDQTHAKAALATSQTRFVTLAWSADATPQSIRATFQTSLPKFLAAPGQSVWNALAIDARQPYARGANTLRSLLAALDAPR